MRCSCGNTFTTRSTKPEIHLELCNECHPFFTGKQKLVDSGGRVERFQRRYAKTGSRKKADASARLLIRRVRPVAAGARPVRLRRTGAAGGRWRYPWPVFNDRSMTA